MRDVGAVIRAGGIVAMDAATPSDLPAETVDARTYAHPAIAGRVVVKLVPTVMAPGVDLELETLGFQRRDVSKHLGKQRFRALGFPGWALVHDPKHARFALDVMKEFKAAAKRAQSKPGHARDAFVAIGDKLARTVPHFLPSFWEEAGRTFIANENAMYASQCFEKAREAEAAHGLAIDEDVRVGVYLEFALGGALAAKSISGYARDLVAAYGAAKAYPRFRELAIRRALGGVPPWGGFAKEMRALAKQAGLDGAREDVALLEEIVDSPALAKASNEFWTAYRAAAIALATRNPAARKRLLHLFPAIGVEAAPGWLAMLDEAGALAAFERDAAPDDAGAPIGAAAAWFHRCVGFTDGHACLLPLLERLAPRMKRDGVALDVAGSAQWNAQLYLDLTERALELELVVAEPTGNAAFSFARPFECDPILIQAHPILGARLSSSIAGALGSEAFEARSARSKGLRAGRAQWLRRQLDELLEGALPQLVEGLATLLSGATHALFAEIPDTLARLDAIDPVKALARSIRGGTLAELGSKAIDDALATFANRSAVVLGGNYPHPVLHDATKAVALLHGTTPIEHDFVLPPKAKLQAVLVLDGALLVVFRDAQHKTCAYWSSSPHDVFSPEGNVWGLDGFPTSWTAPDGGTTLGGVAIRRGDRALPATATFIADATKAWSTEYDRSGERNTARLVARELDVRTGAKGRASWPDWVEKTWLDPERALVGCTLLPAPEGASPSPLGVHDGLVGSCRRSANRNAATSAPDLVDIEGRRVELGAERGVGSASLALLRLPGDAAPRLLRIDLGWGRGRGGGYRIDSADGRAATDAGAEDLALFGLPFPPPMTLIHLFSPRDLSGSRALRAIDDETARALIVGATTDREASRGADKPSQVATRAAIATALPTLTAPAIVDAVAALATIAAARVEEIARARVIARAPDIAQSPAKFAAIDDGALFAALGDLVDEQARLVHYGASTREQASRREGTIDELSAAVRAMRSGESLSIAAHAGLRWEQWAANTRGIAVRAMLSTTPESARQHLRATLRVWRDTFLAIPAAAMRTMKLKPIEGRTPWPKGITARVLIEGQSRYFVRSVHSWQGGDCAAIEVSIDGVLRPPGDFTIETSTPIAITADRAWLDVFLADEGGATTHRPIAFSPSLVEALSARTGLTRAEATLVCAGLPNIRDYGNDFLGKAMRETLDLKAKDASSARERFRSMTARDTLAFFDLAAPSDCAMLVSTDDDTRRAALVEGLSRACAQRFGRGAALDEALVAACDRDLDLDLPTPLALAALMHPDGAAILTPKAQRFDEVFGYARTAPVDALTARALHTLTLVVLWANHALPVGDPARAQVPALHRALLAALADPKLLMALSEAYVDPSKKADGVALVHAIGGAPTTLTAEKQIDPDGRDDGHVVGGFFGAFRSLMAFRPATIAADHPVASRVVSSTFNTVVLLRSARVSALVDRISTTPLEAGSHEANPLHCAPEIVESVRRERGLSRDASVHYLQLLALAEPTSRSVQAFNGWSTKTYKETVAELSAAKLVVEGKRERAGRDVFLPGGWEKVRTGKSLPHELWKRALYADALGALGRMLPTCPHGALFEQAWARVVAGDAPKFEEV